MSLADSGRTYRKISDHIPQNPLLKFDFKSQRKNAIDLFEFRYSADVCYSTKKRNRWMLSSMLCDEEYETEEPFIYTKQQCIWDQRPVTTNYLFDSLTNKKVGSIDISDQKLHGNGFNGTSVINMLENEFNYSKREMTQFYHLKNRGKDKRKKSRKNHRGISTFIPQHDEVLPPKEEYLQNLEKRKDCVHIKEYVHINNLSRVNIISSTKKKNTKNPSKMKELSSRKRLISDDVSTNSELGWKEMNEDEKEEIEDLIDCLESQSRASFEITNNILVNKPKMNERKRRTHKRIIRQLSQPLSTSLPLHNPEQNHHVLIEEETINNFFINLNREILPHIMVDISNNTLKDDLEAISGICRCWVSDTTPRIILVDLENILETTNKSYIVLKPTISKVPELVSVKVSFNSVECDFLELLNRQFVNLRDLVHSLQSPTKSRDIAKPRSSQCFLQLKSSDDDLDRVWHTSRIENQTNIYLEHEEWKKYEIDENKIMEIVRDVSESQAFVMENCEICFTEIPSDETIIINACKHIVCETCLSSHLIYRLEMGMEILNCPGSECSVELDCATTLSLLSRKQYQKRLNILGNSVIRTTGTTCYKCGAVLIWKSKDSDNAGKILEYMCRCNERLCILCGKRQHWPSSCLEMRKHNQKLRKLKDLEIISQKVTPLIVKGVECPKCSYFVEKNGGCNHLTCICGAHFCWICGDLIEEGDHVLYGFPCLKISLSNHLRFDLTYYVPEASENRPKLYILSLKQRISSLRVNTKILFSKINELFDPKVDMDYGRYDAKVVENQFIQLLCVTESSLVKAYQLNKGKKLNLYNYLRNSVRVLMFYQDLIKQSVETVHYSIKHHRRGTNTITNIKSNYSKLDRILSDAQIYINQMHSVLRV